MLIMHQKYKKKQMENGLLKSRGIEFCEENPTVDKNEKINPCFVFAALVIVLDKTVQQTWGELL